MSARRSSLFTTSALSALVLAAVWSAPAHAQLVQGPTPAQSNGGAPTINQAGGNTTVTLGGSRTVIDWDRFDINSGERADFIFANRSDIVLNRVGGAGSTINGDLNGVIGAGGPNGGNIWIYNANGVVIGANARINTGGLLVTTAALDRATDGSAGGFLDGSSTSFNFSGAYDGARIDVRTGAQINTRGGALALVSPIINTEAGSTMTASDGGNVLYGSASGYKVSFRPTSTNDLDLLSFEVATGAGGYGGTAYLQGDTSGNRVFVSVVSQTGLVSQLVAPGAITATTVGTDETGAIVLTTNRDIVNGAVAASAVAGSGTGNLSAGDLTASAIDLVSSGYVLLNGSQNAAGGSIRLVAETGHIHQNGPKITANTLSASAAGNVELGAGASGTPNSVAKLTSLTSTSGYISFAGDSYEIAGPITTPGAVGLSSTGLITGAGLISAGSLSFDAAGTLNVAGNANIDYSNASGDMTINAAGGISMTGGMRLNNHVLTLNAATGNIVQTGDAIYNGGTVRATAAGNIDFGGQTNHISSFYGTSVAGDISVKSAGSLSFAVDTLGNATVDAGGAAIAGAAMHAGTLGIRAANYIDLNQSVLQIGSYRYLTSTGSGVSINTDSTINIGGNISVASTADVSLRSNAGAINQTAGTIAGRQLYLQAAGSIVQDASAVIHGTGVTAASTTVQAGDDLILAGANRLSDYGDVFLGWGSDSDVTYRSAYSLFFNGGATPIGALTLIADQGGIQQGNVAFTANSLTASAAQDIDLGTSANNSIARLGNISSSTGEVRLRVGANNPLAIDGTISSASRVIFSARGAVSGSGKFSTPGLYLGLIGGGTVNVAGSTNLLELGASNADATVRADDSLTVSGALAANGHRLTLIAGTGSITQTGGSFVGTGSLSASAAGDISLSAANSFDTVDATSTGAGRITLNAIGAVSVALNTAGSAAVTAGGNLSSHGITADSLSVEAGHIDLTNSVDVNSFTRLAATYGDVLVTNNGSFTIAGDVSASKTGLRTVDLRANGGGISQTAGTISGHYISLRGAGDLVQSGTGRVDSNAAYFSGANVLLGGANNLVSNDTRIVTTGNLTLRNSGAIDLTVIGGYTNGGVLSLTSDNGSITSADAINASALTAHAANGVVTFNNTNNLISEIRGLSAGTNATVRASGGYTLTGDIDVGGTLALYARTGINQTGGRIKATTLDAQLNQTMTTGSVLLGGANDVDNLYVLAASGGGDVLFRDTDGFRVTYAVIGNRVTLTSDAGAITQASGFMDGVQASQLTVSAVDGISLNNEWNGIRTILGLSNSGTGGIDIASRGVNMVLNGNVTAAGQTVNLAVQNASLSQTGGAIIARRLDAAARTGITLTQAGNNVSQLGTLSNGVSGGITYIDANGYSITGNISAAGQSLTLGSLDSTVDIYQANTGSTITAGTLNINGGRYYSLRGVNGTGNAIDAIGNINVQLGLSTIGAVDFRGDVITNYIDLLAGGDITQSSGRIENQGGQLAFWGTNISLTSATNRLGNILQLRTWDNGPTGWFNVGTGNITLVSAGDVAVGYVSAVNASLTSGGNIGTISSGLAGNVNVERLSISSGGTISLAGAIRALGNVTATGETFLNSWTDLALTGTVNTGTGALALQSGGAISQTGGSITAGVIDVSAATGIDLGRTNFIDTVAGLSTTSGNITYRNWSNIVLPNVSAPGTLTLISETGSITQGSGTSVTAGTLAASAADAIDLTDTNHITSLGALSASNAIAVSTQDSLTLTGDISAASVALTSSTGAMSQTGGIVTTPTLTLRAGSDITLDRANAVGVFNAWAGIGGAITLRNAGNLVVNAITAQNGTVNLISNTGSVSQLLVPGNSIWTGKLNANAATDIDLAAQNFTGLLGNLMAGGSIRYNSFMTLGLEGNISASGGVTFGISGYLGQYSGTIAASHLDVTATGVALIGANDIGSTTASTFAASDDITFRSVNSILLGAVTTPGLLSLTSDSGGIGQTTAFSAGRFDAIAAGDVVLEQLNTLDTVNDVTAGGVFSLRTSGALELDGRIMAPDRVAFNTGGGLTQIGNTVIVTDRLEATAGTATSTGIRLLNHNRVGAVSFDASGNDIRFRNTGNIAINAINSPTGTVELISNIGKITQQSSGGLVAGSLILNAFNGVELYNNDNQIARLDVVSRGLVSIHTGGSGWGGLLTVDRIDAAGQTVSVNNYTWGITGGNITAATLTVFSAGDMDLGTTNNVTGNVGLSGRNIAFTNLGNLVIDRVLSPSGNAVLRSEEGAISQTGSALVDTVGLTAYGRDGVTLAGAIKRIDGLSAGLGADVEIVTDRALELAGDITARNVLLRSNMAPNVFTPTGGAITQTGGVITADLFRGSAYGAIDLRLGNQIAALGDVWSFTSGISITSGRALDLTGALTATNGDVVLDAASIGQSGGSIEALGLRARATGAIDLGAANLISATGTVTFDAGADIAFRNDGGFTLGMVDTPGAATFTSTNGSIGQATSTRIGASRLSVSAANGGIALNEANLVDTLGGLAAGGDIVFRNAGDFALDGDIAAAGHEVTLRSNTGAISQTSGTITALGLSAAAGGAITLGGANSVNNLRDVTAGGDFLYRNATALMLWGDVTAAGHEVTLKTDSGSLLQMLFTSGIITANRLNASAGGALNFNHANRVNELGDYGSGSGVVGFTNDGSFALAGDISGDELVLQSLTGGITQTAGSIDTGSIHASADGSILLNRANQVAAAGPVRLVSNTGNVTFRALGDFTLDFSFAAATFDVTSDHGKIGQSGLITANLLNARAGGDIILTGDNAVTNLGMLNAGGDIAFTAVGNLLFTDAIDAGGNVSLVASTGEITQSGGAITAASLNVVADRNIALGGANTVSAFAGTSTSGDIALRSTGSISLGAVSLPGTFVLTSDAGAVTQTGDLAAGLLDVTARDGITLTRSGNAIAGAIRLANLGTGGIAYTGSGDILIGAIRATGQTVALRAAGKIDQQAGIEAGTLNLSATNATLLSAGNLIDTLGAVDVSSLSLSTDTGLDLAGAVTASGTVSLAVNGRLTQSGGLITAPSLSITASGGIDLGSINQVDALTATNSGGSGDVRFVNGRALTVNNLVSDHGDLTLRLTAGQLTLGGTIFSLGNMDLDVAGNIGGSAGLDSRASLRAVSGGSIVLRSVSGRDDILINAAGDATVAELVHLSGGTDAAGNGYIVDILGNNVTLGASDPGTISGVHRLHVETSPVVRLGARAGNATLNLATMNGSVSIAATGDVLAYAVDDLNLTDIVGTNVDLTSANGDVLANRVDVAGNYSLAGRYFYNGALQPIGTRAGRWTLTTGGDLDASGRTLEFGGGIDFTVGGTLSNGSFRSLAGAVSITAGSVDLYQIAAANGGDVLANSGNLDLFSADTAAGNLSLTAGTVRVSGALAAGADIAVVATTGDAIIGYATAGRNIGITAQGDATLRQANLTGATGDLTIGAGGNATLGDDDAMSGIGTDRWFVRAVGSTGMASITGGAGVSINLDHSARLDNISGRRVEVNVATGDLTIGQLTALTERGIVKVLGGSLVIGSAAATGSALDLFADGDLTLLSSANGYSIYLTAGGLLDTRTATINGGSYVELTGGEVRAGAITSGGDIDVLSTSGAITVDSVHSTGGDAIFSAFTDLNLGDVVANGGQLQAGGNATLRAITAANGFALVALGNITLGADTVAQITGSNLLATGGSLSGCACGSGGATLISLNGSVNVNLQSATGVFDTIAAGVSGDANVHVATGDLGIGDLAGHNIAVTLPGGTLTVTNPVSSGGNYTLTARDFAGNALLPIVGGGATRLNNVTITDTDGDLSAGGNLVAAGDIRINSVGNITGALSLLADGDVDVVARAIRLGDVAGRDIVLNASAGGVDVVGAVTVGRNYTLTGTGFFGNALAMTGTRAGDLFVTDTAGDFDYMTLDLGFAGSATLRANGGAIRGGDIGTLGNLSLSASGVSAGLLRSTQGGVDVESSAGADLNGVQASNAIRISAGGDLRLGSADLSGTGVNAFTLAARGDLVFGASSAGAIGSGHVFTSAGSALAGGGVQADGAIAIKLDRSAGFTGIDGGTLELTVRNGDLSIGGIRTVGALFVAGPTGALSIGDVETSAGHIGIAGQGNVTTGAVNGRFVVNIGSGAGSLAFRKITGGDVILGAAGGIIASGFDAGVFADSLALTAGGDVDLATHGTGSRIGRLGAVTIAHGGFALNNLQDLALAGAIDVRDGTLDLSVAGALSQNSGAILAQRLTGSVTNYARLDGTNGIASLGAFNAGGLLLNNVTALGIDGVVDGGASSVTIRSHGGMMIAATGAVRSAAAGDAITLASDGLFHNLAGGAALDAANGRWLIYTQAAGNAGASDPANNFGGLAGRSFYGATYNFATGSFGAAPNAGNRFVYGYRPVLSVLPNNIIVTYDGQVPVLGAGITGLVNGDSAADAWSGAASLSGAGRNAGTYNIVANLGTLASDMNYDFAFGTGTLRIDPRAITATLAANGKIYDGTTAANGTLSLGGVIAGDDVGVSGSLAFGDKNAGTGKTVTASGIALNGADAGNYTVNLTATSLADILARAITATLTANGKTYDGTTGATGTLSLGGVLAGDDVGVTSALAFGDKNAGTGRTVTASSIALSGTDAGNYVVNASATGFADILARAITATLTANGKVYDGTAAATGALTLGGVLAGDTVSASGGYAFTDKNAGTGKTVTANGITLSGADAGNYVVNTSATALADILARVVTATLAANGKVYDGTTAAAGTLSLNGVIAGDTVNAMGSYAFGDKNAGTGKTVTASGIALSGADAGNYTVNATTTALADILARAVTATLTANGKTYDGTTGATGTLSLGGVLAGDQVGAAGSYAFADKNAGNGKTVTASGIALSGADAGNYTVNASATALADIVARAITATLAANGKVYDGTIAATGTLSLGGVLAGDSVNVSGSYAFADRNAGTGKAVTASGITLGGADAGNYSVNTTATGLADILARAITATLAANGRVYDGTTAASGALSLGGVLAGDTVNASGNYAFADRNAGNGKTVTASGITLSGADAGNYTVNVTATALADILARTITATLAANGKVYDGTTAATGALSLSGVIAGDQVGAAGNYAFGDKNAGADKTVTASGITLSGADAANYIVNRAATDVATIARLAITGTATADSRVYDGTTMATGRITLNGVLVGDNVSASAAYAFTDRNAGTARTVSVNGVTLNGADAGNYTVTLGGGPVLADILRRAVTVRANDLTKLFGQRDPGFTWRVVGGSLVAGDGFTGELARTPGEQAGTYAIDRGSLTLSPNYSLTVVPGSLVIRFTQSGADASDALHRRRPTSEFSLYEDPSVNLIGDAQGE